MLLLFLLLLFLLLLLLLLLLILAGIPVEGKSSVCQICINNYRIIILITGVLSLSAWVKYLYRIVQTHHARTRAHMHARTCMRTPLRTHVHTHRRRRLTAVQSIAIRCQPTVTARAACDNAGRWPFESTHELGTRFTRGFGSFSRIKKLLGRTETQTRDRMYCQTIRTI